MRKANGHLATHRSDRYEQEVIAMPVLPISVEHHTPPEEAASWIEGIFAMIDRNEHRCPRRARIWRGLFIHALRCDALDMIAATKTLNVTPDEIADALIAMQNCGLIVYEATPGCSCVLVSVCLPGGKAPRVAQ
jgi:hypothetical protein